MKRMILSIMVVAFATSLTACGGSTKTDTVTQVRQTAIKIESAISSAHPENACQYYADNLREECVSGIAEVKAMGIKPSSILPVNWRKEFDNATITVNGNQAVMNAVKTDKKDMHFVYVDGSWLRSA
jgi:hypothetical protein